MRYSNEYRKSCIELYRQGKWPETPVGIKKKNFRTMIRRWDRRVQNQGPGAVEHGNGNRKWTADEKMELVSQVLAGKSNQEVALSAGINSGTLYHWVQKYKTEGYNGLITNKRGRRPKEPNMKQQQTSNPSPLTESEREELIRLRAENEYIKAEIEVIKKQMALRREKEAARLKAKKQQSSKNSEKKDIS